MRRSSRVSGTLLPFRASRAFPIERRVEKSMRIYIDVVKKGQILASINTDMLELQRKEAQADLNIAQVNCNLAALDYQNNASLASKGLVPEYDLKSSKAALEVKRRAWPPRNRRLKSSKPSSPSTLKSNRRSMASSSKGMSMWGKASSKAPARMPRRFLPWPGTFRK